MREIRFRAWHKENKAFQYSTIRGFWRNGWLCREATSELDGEKGFHEEEMASVERKSFECNAEWQQDTGLKDKNGKEIYEGDIVETEIDDYTFKGLIFCSADEENPGEWVVDTRVGIQHPFAYHSVTVIGNIYENPELLK